MSGAPIISGSTKFASPAKTGITNTKMSRLAWTEKTPLYSAGVRKFIPGLASWARISIASIPPSNSAARYQPARLSFGGSGTRERRGGAVVTGCAVAVALIDRSLRRALQEVYERLDLSGCQPGCKVRRHDPLLVAAGYVRVGIGD